MEISPILMLYMTAVALVFGICGGILNDINRLVRAVMGEKYNNSLSQRLYEIRLPFIGRSLKKPEAGKTKRIILSITVFIQDVLLFSFLGTGVAILNYFFNNGRARAYTPIAVAVGAIFYYLTVGKAVRIILEPTSFFIKAVFFIIFELFHYPIGIFLKNFRTFVKKLYLNLNKTIAKKQKMVYNIRKKKIVMQDASSGYINITSERSWGTHNDS